MPKHARVAILMAAMIIFAVAMLDLVRSRVEASGRALKTATVQYSSIKRIYAAPTTDLVRSTSEGPHTRLDIR
jgi:hypothetical protein